MSEVRVESGHRVPCFRWELLAPDLHRPLVIGLRLRRRFWSFRLSCSNVIFFRKSFGPFLVDVQKVNEGLGLGVPHDHRRDPVRHLLWVVLRLTASAAELVAPFTSLVRMLLVASQRNLLSQGAIVGHDYRGLHVGQAAAGIMQANHALIQPYESQVPSADDLLHGLLPQEFRAPRVLEDYASSSSALVIDQLRGVLRVAGLLRSVLDRLRGVAS
jgi:hypothetical protein